MSLPFSIFSEPGQWGTGNLAVGTNLVSGHCLRLGTQLPGTSSSQIILIVNLKKSQGPYKPVQQAIDNPLKLKFPGVRTDDTCTYYIDLYCAMAEDSKLEYQGQLGTADEVPAIEKLSVSFTVHGFDSNARCSFAMTCCNLWFSKIK